MSSSNTTEFYGLTQYVGSDKPSFTDNNEAFREVDAALHGAVVGVEDAADAVTALTGRVGDVEEAVTGLSGTVGTQGDAITALQNKEISQDGDIAGVKAAALDMICAFNEEAAQSVHAYAIGDFFRYNDVLYKASAVINIGDTIIPNTNCVATNVTEQLLNGVDKVGDLSSLTTTDKTDAVAAINEVNAEIGDLNSLATTDKSSAVAAINEVNSALNKGSVSVIADGVKTVKQLLDELYALVDLSKITNSSKIVAEYTGGTLVYHLMKIQGTDLFYLHDMSTSAFDIVNLKLAASSNSATYTVSGTSPTFGNTDSYVWASGTKFELFY